MSEQQDLFSTLWYTTQYMDTLMSVENDEPDQGMKQFIEFLSSFPVQQKKQKSTLWLMTSLPTEVLGL